MPSGDNVFMPLCHAAPEVLTSARYDAKLADIWSAGVMLYTMLCCSYPFEKQEDDPKDLRTQTKIMQRIMKGGFSLPEQDGMAPAPFIEHECHNLRKQFKAKSSCKIILHSSFTFFTPDTDTYRSEEEDGNARILCVSSCAVPAYALVMSSEGLHVGYLAALQVMPVLLGCCWPVANLAPYAYALQRSTSGLHHARSAESARTSSARCWWPIPGGEWQYKTSRWAAAAA